MAIVSASKAAKLVGKSVPTISRAIKSGKLSAEPRDGGGWKIDTSVLFSVFDAVTLEGDAKPSMLGSETPNVTSDLEAEVKALRDKLDKEQAEREREREQLNEHLEDLRARVKRAEAKEDEARTLLLTDQTARQEPEEPKPESKDLVKRKGRLGRVLDALKG
jgi:septal ring factor EnvC (AmiA/AmiB activator)